MRARYVADPAQAVAVARQLAFDQAHAPRFAEDEPTILREPGQASTTVLYRIENRTPATLRLDRLLPLCGCYSIDPSAWRDIPAGAIGELPLLVDLSRFNTAIRKPVAVALLGTDGTRHLVHGSLAIEMRCSLELADGTKAVLRQGAAELRLLSNRPELIVEVRLTTDPAAAVAAAVERRPTGFQLRFSTTTPAPMRTPVSWKAEVILQGGAVERFAGTVAGENATPL